MIFFKLPYLYIYILVLLVSTSKITFSQVSSSKNNLELNVDFLSKVKQLNTHRKTILQNQYSKEIDFKSVVEARKKASSNQLEKGGGIDLDWEFLGPNNAGARVRSILVDKFNSDRIYAGTGSGGLFISNDKGETWISHPQNSLFESLSISSIAQSANGIIYFGTGEYIEDNEEYGIKKLKHLGNGIYRSTNEGETFIQLEDTKPNSFDINNPLEINWAVVTDIATHPNDETVLYAGTNNGFYKSINSGNNWELIEEEVTYDIEIGNNDIVHVLAGESYYRSLDGISFENRTDLDDSSFRSNAGNKRIAISPSNPEFVYIVTIEAGNIRYGKLKYVYRSMNSGDSWIIIAVSEEPHSIVFPYLPVDPALHPFTLPEIGDYHNKVYTGHYAMSLIVDPIDNHRIYIGGAGLWTWSAGTSWEEIDFPYEHETISNYLPRHKHDLAFDPSNPDRLFMATELGIGFTDDLNDENISFEMSNNNLSAVEIYSVSANLNGSIVAGASYAGTLYNDYTNSSDKSFNRVFNDFTFNVFNSNINPNVIGGSHGNGKFLRSVNNGITFHHFVDNIIDCQPTNTYGSCGGDFRMDGEPIFNTPIAYYENFELFLDTQDSTNPVIKAAFITGSGDGYSGTGRSRVWLTTMPLDLGDTPRWYNIGRVDGGTTNISAVTLSKDGSTAYVGTDNGKILRIGNMNSLETLENIHQDLFNSNGYSNPNETQLEVPFAGRYITSLSCGPSPNQLLITLGNYGNDDFIYYSFNATSSEPEFNSVQSDLPQAPVYTALFDKENPNLILAGTEHGIWTSEISFTGIHLDNNNWENSSEQIGNAAIYEIKQEYYKDVECYITYAAGSGRGIWRTTSLSPLECDTSLPDWVPPVGIAETTISKETHLEVTVRPNPISSFGKINIIGNKPSIPMQLKVFNLLGQVIIEKELGLLSSDLIQMPEEFRSLQAGQYFLSIEQGTNRASTKILVE